MWVFISNAPSSFLREFLFLINHYLNPLLPPAELEVAGIFPLFCLFLEAFPLFFSSIGLSSSSLIIFN
jgi:hypothetical protein